MRDIKTNMGASVAANLSQSIMNDSYSDTLAQFLNGYCLVSHSCSVHAGWWDATRNFGELIALIHSEISEAMEGGRKDEMDEHLPEYSSVAVELADAVVRIADLAGALNIPLGDVVVAKMRYNAQRLDHKRENRAKEGGKQF